MVATISVLSGGASGVARYFSATSGYYDVEQSGVWFGEAADKLNLYGNINRLDFEMVLAGYAPSGDRLAKSPRTESPAAKVKAKVREQNQTQPSKPQGKTDKRERADRVPGYDLCFSAPKSVSSLWAVGSKQVRTDIEVCMREAVRKTLGDVESLLPLGRRGRNGTQQIAAELVTAMFLHTTSRDLDPQLHIHSVIANLCFGEDGRWSSVNSRMLHNWTPALGRVFRCHLASVLMDRMNVQLERPLRPDGKPESWFEVKGVAKEVIEEFSQRRQAIEKATPSEKLSDSHARSRANKETRRKKDPEADVKTLRKQWNERAGRHGLTQESVNEICSHRGTREQLTPEELQKTFDDAIRAVGQEKAHFREWNVVSKVCETLQHRGVDATTVVPQLLKHLHQSPAVVPLDEKPRQGQFSTQKNWQCETALLNDVNELSNTRGAQVSKRTIDKVCKKCQKDRAKPFSDEQSKAVQDLLSDQKSIRVLTGVAGAGKSVTLDAVRLGFERQGYQVIGGALAGTAAAGLKEKTGMPTRTVASYLYHLEKGIPRRLADRARFDARMMIRALRGKRTYKYERVKIPHKSVLIIDEAGMLDTRTMSRLVHHVKEAKATLILVGDTSQLPPIEAGGPLDRIARRLGHARLSTNHRQLDKADAKAASALRAGKVKESLDNYSQRGRLTVTKNHQETIEQVVETWRDQGGTKRPEQHIILTQTRADAHEVNHRCQKERLASKTIPGLGVRHGDTTYYRGDRVMFHVPMRKFGIENGFTGTVLSVNPIRRHVSVRLDNEPPAKRGKKVSRKSKFVTIPLFRMDHAAMSLGYAATTHKLQGATVDHALVLLGGKMLSKELAYTQLTRARETTRLFASEEQAGKNLELLIKGMSRSVKKDLAHDVKERSGNGFRVQETRQQSSQSLQH